MAEKILKKTAIAALLSTLAVTAAAQVFTIRDIRVEGIQRTEPGTVFSYLPFRVGDEYSPELGTEAIHALYGSGLFRDVSVACENDVLVLNLAERPAISAVETNGIKAFDKDVVLKSLRGVGLTEGRIFDQHTLDRADQELRRQYLSRGYYASDVTASVTPEERNRVRVVLNVEEGEASRISKIRFVGNSVFDRDELLDVMQLSEHKWSSWYTRRDLYSREKLAADLESIKSYYMNRGYLDFKLDSVQVSVAPNKSDVFITVNLTEGKQYTVESVALEGDLLGLESEIKPLVKVNAGEVYNAEKMTDIGKDIADRYSAMGYAFCKATPNPVVSEGKDTVKVVYTVDPGRRSYVRRVNIVGNSRTRDDVIRREVRQYESAWFDSDKVKASRDRIDRLGYFETVTAEPKPVEGTRDQVDLEVAVKERPTGSISLGAGFSTSDGVILSAGFKQDNVFGTGKSVSLEVNTSDSQRTYALTLTEPYVTTDGISRTWELFDRKTDLDELDVSNVAYETMGLGLSFGIPVTELDRIFVGTRAESTSVTLRGWEKDATGRLSPKPGYHDPSPDRYGKFVNDYGKDARSLLLTLGWSRDSRDNALAPTRGRYQRFNAEVSTPGFDTQYYKATYQITQYIPLSKSWTLGMNLEVGYGDSYGNKDFPFFKNYYVGGIGSVRGYESSSLGPRDNTEDDNNVGGDRELAFSIELLTPLPGMDRTLRGLVFFDGGYAWGFEGNSKTGYHHQRTSLSDLRFSWGVGVAWISPMGPLKFSLAFPINKKKGDDTQRFQFQMGTGF